MISKNEHRSRSPSQGPTTNNSVPDTPCSLSSFEELEDDVLLNLPPGTIAQEMDGEFVQCSVEDFIKAYLSFAPDEAQTQCIMDQYSFRQYPTVKGDIMSSSHASPDITAFSVWADIAEAIASAAPEIGRQVNQFRFRNMPNKRITSDIPGSNNRIDAGFIRKRGKDCNKLRTTDIAVVVVHKPFRKLKRLNALRALSANIQIMNDDVRRMFSFSITVESSEVTLWYHCRSHSAVSRRFNLVKEPHLLIRVLAAFSFATEEQLGYDPMIAREQDGRYTFKLPDLTSSGLFQHFRTIGTLSEYRMINITSRMARVYTVNRLDCEGNAVGDPLVLKDVWLDGSAKTEWEIQEAIFKDIEDFWAGPTSMQEMKEIQNTHKHLVSSGEYKKYFLEIVLDHVGTVTPEPPRASIHKRGLLFDSIFGSGAGSTSSITETRSTNAGTHPIEFENITQVPVSDLPFKTKKRYQVVFKDVCRTVGQLKILGEVVDVLRQTLIPLQLLLCAGWVHRDISSGNILAHRVNLMANEEPWQAKLADFEYAKKFPQPYSASADPKTGTPYFMPLEIMLNRYLYDRRTGEHAKAVARGENVMDQPLEDFLRERKKHRAALLQQPTITQVNHNFQHDLESLWWILLWTVTCRINSEAAFAYGRLIFVNQMIPTDERRRCFTAYNILYELEKFLPMPKTEDEETFAEMIDNLRDFMNDEYIKRVAKGNQDKPEKYLKIFAIFTYGFNIMQKTASDWAGIHLIGRISTQAQLKSVVPGRQKRRREEESIADARQIDGEERSEAKLPKMETEEDE